MDEVVGKPVVLPAYNEPFQWWHRLSADTQNEIDARAEEFTDFADYWRREILPAADKAELAKYIHLDLGALQWQEINRAVGELLADQEMLSSLDHARNRIDQATLQIKQCLEMMFNVKSKTRVESPNETRDRGWSKAMFQGQSAVQVAAESHSQRTNPQKVTRFVQRHRESRGYFGRNYSATQWRLRSAIYWREFSGKISRRTYP